MIEDSDDELDFVLDMLPGRRMPATIRTVRPLVCEPVGDEFAAHVDKQWQALRAYLNELGEDVDELLAQAARNLEAWENTA